MATASDNHNDNSVAITLLVKELYSASSLQNPPHLLEHYAHLINLIADTGFASLSRKHLSELILQLTAFFASQTIRSAEEWQARFDCIDLLVFRLKNLGTYHLREIISAILHLIRCLDLKTIRTSGHQIGLLFLEPIYVTVATLLSYYCFENVVQCLSEVDAWSDPLVTELILKTIIRSLLILPSHAFHTPTIIDFFHKVTEACAFSVVRRAALEGVKAAVVASGQLKKSTRSIMMTYAEKPAMLEAFLYRLRRKEAPCLDDRGLLVYFWLDADPRKRAQLRMSPDIAWVLGVNDEYVQFCGRDHGIWGQPGGNVDEASDEPLVSRTIRHEGTGAGDYDAENRSGPPSHKNANRNVIRQPSPAKPKLMGWAERSDSNEEYDSCSDKARIPVISSGETSTVTGDHTVKPNGSAILAQITKLPALPLYATFCGPIGPTEGNRTYRARLPEKQESEDFSDVEASTASWGHDEESRSKRSAELLIEHPYIPGADDTHASEDQLHFEMGEGGYQPVGADDAEVDCKASCSKKDTISNKRMEELKEEFQVITDKLANGPRFSKEAIRAMKDLSILCQHYPTILNEFAAAVLGHLLRLATCMNAHITVTALETLNTTLPYITHVADNSVPQIVEVLCATIQNPKTADSSRMTFDAVLQIFPLRAPNLLVLIGANIEIVMKKNQKEVFAFLVTKYTETLVRAYPKAPKNPAVALQVLKLVKSVLVWIASYGDLDSSSKPEVAATALLLNCVIQLFGSDTVMKMCLDCRETMKKILSRKERVGQHGSKTKLLRVVGTKPIKSLGTIRQQR